MAENDNSFLTANNIYEEVEGEAGKNLSLEEDQQLNLVGIIKSRFDMCDSISVNNFLFFLLFLISHNFSFYLII